MPTPRSRASVVVASVALAAALASSWSCFFATSADGTPEITAVLPTIAMSATVTAVQDSIAVPGTIALQLTVRDGLNVPIIVTTAAWSTSDVAIAVVTPTPGNVSSATLRCVSPGMVVVSVLSRGVTGTRTITCL